MDKVTTEEVRAHRVRAHLASQYAARGWHVLPTRERRPVIKDWENEATADPDEAIAAWDPRGEWSGYNIGIACGPSGLVVIDLDTKNGKNGPEEFAKLLAQLGIELPPTLTVRTPSGGTHLYFQAPPGVEIRLSASQIAKGVDIRAWGGQVVAPGSVADGRPYTVEDNTDPAPLPTALVEHLLRMPSSRSRAGHAERIPEVIPQGERESVLVSMAGTMRRRGMSAEAILAALEIENDTRCIPPLEQADLERIAHSVARYEPADTGPVGDDETEIQPDPELVRKRVVELASMEKATAIVRAQRARRQREILGGMSEPMSILDFINSGPDPTKTCLWGNPTENGTMAWAQNQGTIIAGPPGTGKSTIALQVILRRCGIVDGDVLGLPVTVAEDPTVYLALDRADQIRQSARRMLAPDLDPEVAARLQVIDALPLGIDLRDPVTFIEWLKDRDAGCVAMDSAKDLGFDLNDSSEGQAFNHLIQAVLRADIQVLVTHHSRKTPRGDRKPLTLNDLHGSQWVAAGAGSVIMLDGEAGPKDKRLFHVKPLTVPMAPLSIGLVHDTGEITYRDYNEDEEGESSGRVNVPDRVLELLAGTGPMKGEAIARTLGCHSGTVSRACRTLSERGQIKRGVDGWELDV